MQMLNRAIEDASAFSDMLKKMQEEMPARDGEMVKEQEKFDAFMRKRAKAEEMAARIEAATVRLSRAAQAR